MKYCQMKDLPETQLPYEKCIKRGPESLSEAELLAVILRSGCNQMRVTDVALQIIQMCEQKGGIAYLGEIPQKELIQIRGIGQIKGIQLACIAEFSKRMWHSRRTNSIKMESPQMIADYFMEDVRKLEVEETRIIFLDGRNHITGNTVLTRGTVNASLISTREIFKEAIKNRAVFIVLLHNHPSGDPYPSKDDILITQKVCEAGRLMDIELLDHIIIGDCNYVSLKEKGII